MKIEHLAIWTYKLETLKEYYCQYFGGISNNKYINEKCSFKVILSALKPVPDWN